MIYKSELENKIPDLADVLEKANFTELGNKISDISNLATKTALTTVENKIPGVSNLLKTTDSNTQVPESEKKLTDHNHGKYIDTLQFDKLAADNFNARIAPTNLMTKTDFDAKLSILNRKITKYITKLLLVENELNKLKTFDYSYFISKSHFDEDGIQNYLVFQLIISYQSEYDYQYCVCFIMEI